MKKIIVVLFVLAALLCAAFVPEDGLPKAGAARPATEGAPAYSIPVVDQPTHEIIKDSRVSRSKKPGRPGLRYEPGPLNWAFDK